MSLALTLRHGPRVARDWALKGLVGVALTEIAEIIIISKCICKKGEVIISVAGLASREWRWHICFG
jgi:hypothetical protein